MRPVAVLLLVGALLAGCGGDEKPSGPLSKAEYEKEFQDAVADSENAGRIDTPPNASREQQTEALEEGLDRLQKLTKGLDELEPPADIRRAHDLFVSGLTDIQADYERVIAAFSSGDEAEVRRIVDAGPGGSFARPETLSKLREARQEFEKKGYDLGEISQAP